LGPDTGICSGSVLQLNAMQPAGSYLWNDGNTSATVSASPGAWSVAVTVNGCTGTDGITIVALPSPLLELPDDTTLCDGATWLIDVDQSGASYQWMDGSSGPSYQVQQPGTYGVTVSLGACSATDDVVVDYIDASVITLGNDTTLCPGEQLVLVLDVAGIQLTWPDGGTDNTYTVSSAGTYTVQANAGGCLMSDVITVGYTPLPIPQLGDDRQLCEGDSLRLNVAAQNASVLWSDGSTNDSILVVGSATITVTLALDGCLASDQVNVVFMPVVDDLDLGPDATICLGDELVLDAGTPLATYSWNTGEGGPTITVTRPGIYHVVLTGPCINAADTVAITEGNCAPLVNVPNAFTPDGDGTNEVFAPVVSGTVRAWELRIFDRWGEELFNSNEPHKGWDGTFNGTPVQDGVYVWQLGYKAVSDDGVKQEKLTGSVTLLR
ncbi:MAG: gliding motility-associated C-terminal domain-containing protein, partial [Flavobacteriales bacterium]|nr:gliding motility-associated C-terminal domain-containing protein [Flavobacteriales bacterium]